MNENRLPKNWITEGKMPTAEELFGACKQSAESLGQDIPGLTDGDNSVDEDVLLHNDMHSILPEDVLQTLDDNLGYICDVMNDCMDSLNGILKAFTPGNKEQMLAFIMATEALDRMKELLEDSEEEENEEPS